jgi:hypothetical protein
MQGNGLALTSTDDGAVSRRLHVVQVLGQDNSTASTIMSINDLPVEILEQIASEIESPSDLCSFGVSRKLRSIIFPSHIQLRIIRCPLLSSIWEKLSVHRSLAANVRVLQIQSVEIKWNRTSVDPPVIPAIFDEPNANDEESTELARLSSDLRPGTFRRDAR